MTLKPQGIEELADIVRASRRIAVRGGGTKSRPASGGETVLELTDLAGIVDYSPEECVLTARAGTALSHIVEVLGQHGQYLPFDPPFVAEGATLGGTVASGVSGPGRYRYGGVRDFVIGMRIVDGAGRQIRSGGQVVKNAAGFLLHHGMVGSCGRFAVLTEVTCKVFPAPEARRTVVVSLASAEDAFRAARRIERLRYDCESIEFDERGTLGATVAGRQAAIDERAARLAAALGGTFDPAAGTVPAIGGQSPNPGTVPEPGQTSGVESRVSLVRVVGVMNSWQKVRAEVSTAHFMCAGAVAWVACSDVARLAAALAAERLTGQVIRGPHAGDRIGHVIPNEFEERVRRVLDPENRFSAAPDPRH